MRARVAVVAMMAAALLATACAPMRVSAHVDRAQDFSGYRTFDWGPADALPAGDPRLERSPFFQDHIQGAIERQMAAKGFERAAVGGAPDLRIHFHAVIASRLDVDELDYQRGYCPGSDCRSGVSGSSSARCIPIFTAAISSGSRAPRSSLARSISIYCNRRIFTPAR